MIRNIQSNPPTIPVLEQEIIFWKSETFKPNKAILLISKASLNSVAVVTKKWGFLKIFFYWYVWKIWFIVGYS